MITLQAADLATLLPSSTVPLASVLRSGSLPTCVRDALRAAYPNAKSSESGARQRFTLAVAVAVQSHLGRADLLGRPKSVLQLPPAESALQYPAGNGLLQPKLTALALGFDFSASLPVLMATASLEKIDLACRILLHALFTSPRSAGTALGALYDASRPSDALETVLPSLDTLHSAPASLQRSVSTAAAVFPAFPALKQREFSLPQLSPPQRLQRLPAVSALQQLSLSSPAAASNAAMPAASSSDATPALLRATAHPTDGSQLQCWYSAVASALQLPLTSVDGTPRKHCAELERRIRSALAGIHSAPLLSAYSFHIDPTADDAEVQRVKAAYLSSSDLTQQQQGGNREMYLLSHFHNGALAFRSYSSVPGQNDDQRWRFACALPGSAIVAASRERRPPVLSAHKCNPTRTVYLHHCAYQGGSSNNHWEPLTFTLSNGSELHEWPTHSAASADDSEQQHRHRLVQAACMKSRIRVCTAAAAAQASDRAVAAALVDSAARIKSAAAPAAAAVAPARPTKPPLKHKRSGASGVAAAPTSKPVAHIWSKSRGAVAAEPAAAGALNSLPASQPVHSRVYQPPQTRPNVWRELPSSCRSRFLAVSVPMFERYARLSSAGDFDRCAAVLNLMLDLPSQSLLRKGHVRELKQALEQSMDHFTAQLAAAASDDAGASNSTPAASLQPLTQPLTSADSSADMELESVSDTFIDADSSAATVADEPAAPANDLDPLDDDATTRAVRRATGILREGAPRAQRRAFRSLSQAPLASITSSTIRQLRDLHPTATEQMRAVPANKALEIAAVDPKTLLTLLKRRVNNGAAPGPSGWTGSHLQLIASGSSEQARDGLCLLIRDICNGVFGGATQQRLLASVLMPIGKKDGRSVRPIAMGEVLVKLAAHYCMSLIEEQLPTLFPRIQFGVKRAGGSEAAAQLTRALFEQSRRQHGTTIALKTDFANAFNAASRARIWDTLLKHPETEPLWRMFHWAYSDPSALLLYDRSRLHTRLPSSEGVRQGDPFAAFAFALSVQPLYEAAIDGLSDCHAVSVQDDLTLIGPAEQVFAAFDRIVAAAPDYHLSLRVEKCAVYVPVSLADEQLMHAEVLDGCNTRQLAHSASLESLGVLLGSDDDVRAHCDKAVAELEERFRALRHPAMSVQDAFLLLRSCALPSLAFLTRTVPPELLRPAAQRFDSLVRDTFLHLMQLQLDRIATSGVATAEQLREMISLPLKLGGMGLRPAERVAASAYFASAAAILPDFLRAFPALTALANGSETELFQQLQECRALMESQGVSEQLAGAPSKVAKKRRGPKPGAHAQKMAAAAAAVSPTAAFDESPVLRSSVDQLWSAAAAFDSVGNTKEGAFLQAERVQRSATQLIEERVLQSLRASSSVRRRILLVANSNPHCSDFLTVLPTQPCYRMADASMQLAVRHRLGALPYDSLTDQQCFCTTHDSFADDPDHFHSCTKCRRSMLTLRHDNVVQVLQDLAVSVGFNTIREPNSHIRPDSLASLPASSVEYNHHADLLLLKHGMKLYVDVTVVRPTNNTTVAAARDGNTGASIIPLAAARVATAAKHKKYDEIARANGYRMIPFALESYGGISSEASSLLQTMSAHSVEYSPADFLLHAHKRLSVALQSSNADIAQLAMQQFHLRQHAANKSSYDLWQRKHEERVRAYAQPANGDRLAASISAFVQAADMQAMERHESLLPVSDPSRLAFVHQRRVGHADVARTIDNTGIITCAA